MTPDSAAEEGEEATLLSADGCCSPSVEELAEEATRAEGLCLRGTAPRPAPAAPLVRLGTRRRALLLGLGVLAFAAVAEEAPVCSLEAEGERLLLLSLLPTAVEDSSSSSSSSTVLRCLRRRHPEGLLLLDEGEEDKEAVAASADDDDEAEATLAAMAEARRAKEEEMLVLAPASIAVAASETLALLSSSSPPPAWCSLGWLSEFGGGSGDDVSSGAAICREDVKCTHPPVST